MIFLNDCLYFLVVACFDGPDYLYDRRIHQEAEVTGAQQAKADETKGQRTRRRILEAARAVFAEAGYERATIRAIAAAADVDKSSVIQYFGSKQQLFREAVHWTIPLAEVVRADPDHAAENLARGMFAAWTAEPNSPMTVLLRASMTSEDAAELLRGHVTEQFTDALAAVIDAREGAEVPNARLRAVVAGALLMGVASQRYLLRIPVLCDVETDELLDLITPLLKELIDPA